MFKVRPVYFRRPGRQPGQLVLKYAMVLKVPPAFFRCRWRNWGSHGLSQLRALDVWIAQSVNWYAGPPTGLFCREAPLISDWSWPVLRGYYLAASPSQLSLRRVRVMPHIRASRLRGRLDKVTGPKREVEYFLDHLWLLANKVNETPLPFDEQEIKSLPTQIESCDGSSEELKQDLMRLKELRCSTDDDPA